MVGGARRTFSFDLAWFDGHQELVLESSFIPFLLAGCRALSWMEAKSCLAWRNWPAAG